MHLFVWVSRKKVVFLPKNSTQRCLLLIYNDTRMNIRILTLISILMCACLAPLEAQELNCTVRVNHAQVQGTSADIFESLESAINEFMNNRSWTELQYQREERIDCTLNLTVQKYNKETNLFTCELLFQVIRPVFNTNYTSTIFSKRDPSFVFTYQPQDALEFNANNMNNNLTAMLAYYAYLFIGMDLDTFSPLGGTAVLQIAESIVNNAQTMSEPGWKAFDKADNRHGIINDYLDSSLEPFRLLQYKYYRQGLDEMAQNADRGRSAITEALGMLKEARSNKPLSMLLQIFTDFKRDEIVNIYAGQRGTAKEKETVFNIVSDINASQNTYWNRIKQ